MLKTKEETEEWLKKYKIKNYNIVETAEKIIVNVMGNVDLTHNQLEYIPVKFNLILGHFNIAFNDLTSLEGCPNVVMGSFACSYNKLESLIGCKDMIVKKQFNCNSNKIKRFIELPKEVGEMFKCAHNELESIEELKQLKLNKLDCSNNNIKDIECVLDNIESDIYYYNNKLEIADLLTLEGLKYYYINSKLDNTNYRSTCKIKI